MEVRNKNADPDAKNLPAIIHPNVVVSPHPISAGIGRKLFYADFVHGECLLDYLDRTTLLPPISIQDNFVLSHNGKMMTFEEAESIFPRSGDMVVIRARVHGGDGGSNPLTVVLMIAVIIASQGTAAAWVGMMTGTSMAVGSAVILIGGMLLISALVPIKMPSFDESTPDPTYSLSGSANQSRPYEPLPVAFGTVRMYPDHGARPYTTYEESDQKLIQIFNFGLTNPTLSSLKIGDAPLEDFLGVDYEISSGVAGDLKMFPTNVDTLAGADLVANAGVFIERTSSANTTRLVIDISGLNFFIGREEGLTEARITLTAEYRVAGSADAWSPFFRTWDSLASIIPLVINWTDVGTIDIVNGDKELFRRSYHRTVAEGQYEVRVKLHDLADVVYHSQECDDEGENCVATTSYSARGLNAGGMTQILAWDQLKSYQPDTGDYSNQKRMALEIRANAQLQGVVDSFNAIVSVSIPTWTGAAWVDAVSSNPAWQFLALARGAFDPSGRRIYGAGLADNRIDIETIKLWAVWCDAKNLKCNIVMTGKMTVIDMMNTVARVGRGAATWSNGLLGIVYDEGNKVAVSMFGMSNIVHDSFKVNYVSNNQTDEIVVAFNNPDIGWSRDTVRTLVPGVTIPVNSVTIEIPGITDEAQAAKEANLIAGEQFYRRRIMTWESDIEGLTVQRGDVAILSHDMTQWDYSGRLVAGPTNDLLTLDREVDYGSAAYIGVRHPDGTYEVRQVTPFTGQQPTINLVTPLSVVPDDDTYNEVSDYLWFYGPTATPGKLVKVTDITPLSEDRVRIMATDEDDAYYLSESNSYTYVTPTTFTDKIPTISGLALGESLIIVGSGFAPKVNVSWGIVGEYGGAFIRAGDENTPLKDIGRTLDKTFNFEWPVGKTVIVEVTAHNKNYEMSNVSRDTASLLLVGKMKRPADVSNFTALQNGESVILKWSGALDIDLSGTEIRYGIRGSSTWEDATPLTEVTKGTNITSQDVPDGDWTFYAKHKDTSLNYSANATTSDVVFSSDNDIIEQLEQSPDWIGTLTNFVKHHTGVLVPSSQGDTVALDWRVFDEFVPDPQTICTYESPEIDIGFDDNVRILGDIQSALRGNTGGVANPKLSIDYKLNADAYDGFEDWSIGNAICQQVKHKLTLDTSIGIAIVTGFAPTVDLKEHTDKEEFTVPSGGATVTFAHAFHRPPFPSSEIVSANSGVPAFATVTNVTETGADVNVYNLSNIDVGGAAILTLTGV